MSALIGKDYTVLIVEDQEKNRKILRGLCSKMGHETHEAENGQVALEMVHKRPYHLYIVDLMMPVMDGKAFISSLRELYPDSIVLVQTALDSPDTIIEVMKLGVFDYIIKPIDITLFEKTFRKALEVRRLKDSEIDKLRLFRGEMQKVREVQVLLKPDFSGEKDFDISYAILPAEELSGDFLDGSFSGDGACTVTLCDVSGHGIASSYIGAEIRRIFRMASGSISAPSSIIETVNRIILRDFTRSYYLSTAVFCRIDGRTGTVIYSSGGHPPALLYSAAGKECTMLNTKGPLLGFLREAVYNDVTVSMKPGRLHAPLYRWHYRGLQREKKRYVRRRAPD